MTDAGYQSKLLQTHSSQYDSGRGRSVGVLGPHGGLSPQKAE